MKTLVFYLFSLVYFDVTFTTLTITKKIPPSFDEGIILVAATGNDPVTSSL